MAFKTIDFYNSTELNIGYINALMKYICKLLLMLWCFYIHLDEQLLLHGLLCDFLKEIDCVLN